MRRIASLFLSSSLIFSAMWAAQAASADSVQEKLDKARQDQEGAEQALSTARARVEDLLAQYAQLRTDLALAATDVVVTQAAQDELTAKLAEAQEQLSRRVTTAYEVGPAAAIDLFLGAQSTADFASVQVYVGNTFGIDDSTVSEVTGLKASLADLAVQRQARQARVSASIAGIQDLAAQAEAQLADATELARGAGVKVARLEQEEQALEEARAAAAAALASYLGSGGIGEGCASGTVHDLIVAAFAPLGDDQVQTALAVATRESNCRPNAYNGIEVPPYGHASGVFQILYPGIWESWSERCGYAGADPFDAEANVTVAACTVADQGWWPWGF